MADALLWLQAPLALNKSKLLMNANNVAPSTDVSVEGFRAFSV